VRTAAVVIPTHDRRTMVREAVRTVLEQGPGHEVIVVRSNGDTGADGLDREFPRVVLLECGGDRAAARNAGRAATDRPWVLFLDDDDLLLPGALATLLAAVDDEVVAVRGGRIDFEDGAAVPTPSGGDAVVRRLARDDLVTGAEVLTPSQTLFRTAAVASSPFREELVPVEDYALGVDLALGGGTVLATSAPTTAYRRHAGQTVGAALGELALERRARVLDVVDDQRRIERRLRRRARGHHDLYARLPSASAAGRRGAALAAVASAAIHSPPLVATGMWWRGAAHAALRTGRRR
jgi:hypothetical protein